MPSVDPLWCIGTIISVFKKSRKMPIWKLKLIIPARRLKIGSTIFGEFLLWIHRNQVHSYILGRIWFFLLSKHSSFSLQCLMGPICAASFPSISQKNLLKYFEICSFSNICPEEVLIFLIVSLYYFSFTAISYTLLQIFIRIYTLSSLFNLWSIKAMLKSENNNILSLMLSI